MRRVDVYPTTCQMGRRAKRRTVCLVVQRDRTRQEPPLVLAAHTVIVTIEVPAISVIASSDRQHGPHRSFS